MKSAVARCMKMHFHLIPMETTYLVIASVCFGMARTVGFPLLEELSLSVNSMDDGVQRHQVKLGTLVEYDVADPDIADGVKDHMLSAFVMEFFLKDNAKAEILKGFNVR